MEKIRYIIPLVTTSLVLNFVSIPLALAETSPAILFPAYPGVTLTGLFGDVSSVSADSLIPITGHPDRSLFYLNPQGIFHSTDKYSASLGGGYRLLQDRWGILGGSLFTDYNQSSSHSFWFLSPGLERLGDRFDFSVNGYFPISRQRINTGQVFADEIGDTNSVTFSGHDQLDQLVDLFESTGPGADFTVGVRLPYLKNNTKLYLGTYYFAPKNNDSILGGAVRLEVPVNRFLSLQGSEAYDGVMHNTVKVGLSIALGGRSSGYGDTDLKDRLVDPLQRHLAATAGGSATAEPVLTGAQYTGQYGIERSNIWFFTAGGGGDSCTADSPCQLSQDAINSIDSTNPNANLYVETGQYTLPNSAGTLTLNEGQSLYGRADGFTAAANGNALPTLFGSLELKGDNTVEHLQLFNDGSQTVGIRIDDGAQNVILDSVSVGDSGVNPSRAYKTGIQLGSQDSVYIKDSQINAFSNDDNGGLVAGVKLDGVSDSNLYIDNTNIDVSADKVSDPVGVFVGNDQAIQGNAQNNHVTLTKDDIQVVGAKLSNSAFGVYLGNYFSDNSSSVSNNYLYIKDSQINVKNIDNSSTFGVFLGNYEYCAPAFNNNNIKIDGSSISVTSQASAYGLFEGMYNGNNQLAIDNTLTVNNSNINAVSKAANAFGVELTGDYSNFTLTNNLIQANAENDSELVRIAYGVELKADNDTLNMKGNQIISQAEGSNVLVVGFAEDFYFPDTANNNTVNASSNYIQASSNSDNANVDGVLIQNGWSTANLNNNTIVATGSGKDARVFGVNIAGNDNIINISNNSIQATANGLLGDAYGVAANSGGRYYTSAFDNTIKLSGNKISATSYLGKAQGVVDNAADQNNDDWIILPNNKISAQNHVRQNL